MNENQDPAAQAAWERSVAAHKALAALSGAGVAVGATTAAGAEAGGEAGVEAGGEAATVGSGESIVIVLHPGFDPLDVVGPYYFLSAMIDVTVHLATTGKTLEPVTSAGGLPLLPTTTLQDVSQTPTVLLVPGGDTGVLLADAPAMTAIRRLGEASGTVASVCTGAIALGAAGLLEGRRATSHWSVRHLLADYGATPVNERVVEDGNVFTAAGVTAGMDLALRLVGRLRSDDYARFLELGAEYAPEPPFGAGTPESAGAELTALARDYFAPLENNLRAR